MKGKALILFVFLLAFLWGYKRDELLGVFHSADPTTSEVVTTNADDAPGMNESVNSLPKANVPLPGMGAEVPTTNPFAKTQQPSGATVPMGTPAPFANPVATPVAVSGAAPRRPTLSQTLDSIRPGEITDDMKTRQNAYLELLAKQLRESQGGNPQATPILMNPGANPMATMGAGAEPFASPPPFPPAADPVATPPDQVVFPPQAGQGTHSQNMPMPQLDQTTQTVPEMGSAGMDDNVDLDAAEDDDTEEEDTEEEQEDTTEDESADMAGDEQ